MATRNEKTFIILPPLFCYRRSIHRCLLVIPLEEDLGEANNLYFEHPEIVHRLKVGIEKIEADENFAQLQEDGLWAKQRKPILWASSATCLPLTKKDPKT